jgi:DNA-binding transcriptional LysR family regulator
MNLNSLKTFICIIEEGNFSKAALRLHLSQPAVSMQMQTLAQELGVELFVRRGHRVEPSEGGRVLYSQAREMLQGWNNTLTRLESLRQQLAGRLELGASTVPGDYLLPPLLCEFSRYQPGLEVRMTVDSSQQILDRLRHNRLDLAVVGCPPGQDLLGEVLVRDQLVVVFAKDNPLARRKTLTGRDLLEYPLLQRNKGSATRQVFEQALDGAGFKRRGLKVVMELGSTRALLEAAAQGMGIAVVSKLAAADFVEYGRLESRTLTDVSLERNFWLVCPREQQAPAARAFMEFIKRGDMNRGRGKSKTDPTG